MLKSLKYYKKYREVSAVTYKTKWKQNRGHNTNLPHEHLLHERNMFIFLCLFVHLQLNYTYCLNANINQKWIKVYLSVCLLFCLCKKRNILVKKQNSLRIKDPDLCLKIPLLVADINTDATSYTWFTYCYFLSKENQIKLGIWLRKMFANVYWPNK